MTKCLRWRKAARYCCQHGRATSTHSRPLLTLLLIGALLITYGKSDANDIIFSVNQDAGLLNISAINASDFIAANGSEARNVADGDLRTKWAAPGMSHWILVDLGIPQRVSKTRISFSAYQWGKIIDFTLATSLDGINWTDIIINAQSAPYLQWTEIALTPINARYVRVKLNSANLPGSVTPNNSEINEIEIYGSHIPVVQINVPAITASDYKITTGEVAENAIDGDLRTKWSASGIPQWMTLNLGTPQLVSMVKISFSAYQWGKTYAFTLATSLDGIYWTETIASAESIPYLQWTEVAFTPINARYVRVKLNSASLAGNLDMKNSEINEIEIYGVDTNTPGATLTLSWSTNSAGNVLGYIIYYGPTSETADIEITNLPISTAGFDPQAPTQLYAPYSELGLLPGDNVCFRLKAYNDSGVSQWSDAICGGV